MPPYVSLIAAARFLGHGRPDIQATLPVYWTAAALIVAEAEAEAREES